jgi:hypothetical protein
MRLPALSNDGKQSKQIIEFRGYNHNANIGNGDFYEMQNLSSSFYPVLAPRQPRGTVLEFIKPNGLFAKNKLAWVEGTSFVYDWTYRGSVEDSKKQFVGMGAYILIFPDKKYYNTETDTFGNLETSFTQAVSGTITGCTQNGTDADAAISQYAKITLTGIGANLNQYDGVIIAGCTVAALNGSKTIYTKGNDYIVVAGRIGSITTQPYGLTVNRSVPAMDFVTESQNRVWGCSSTKHEVYCCKLGDPFNWNSFEGISTDSYVATIGSDGDFTGAISFMGYVLFFKEDRLHKVYGSQPSNFQVTEKEIRGVAKGSEKSLAIVNETLYYMSRNGVMAYQGGMPSTISSSFGNEIYTDAVAGPLYDKYYISMKDSKNIWHMFVFDDKKGMWHREDNTKATSFIYLDGKLYYINSANKLMTVTGTDNEVIKWYGEFSDLEEKSMNKKYVSKIQFRAELEQETMIEAWIMYDNNGIWERITTITGKQKALYNIPIRLRRCSFYKIKLSGIGQCKIYSMSKIYSEGSDK